MTQFTPSPQRQSAGRVLVDALALHGVQRVFCVPGESYLEVLDALYDAAGIEVVVAKHEGAAANMAEADGKLSGQPGICMVTRGPGATHASIGVHVAQQDSTPMILFIGQIAREDKGRDVFQEVDYQQLFGRMAKLVIEIDRAERMAELIARAFHVAISGRPGPVVVALPEDMLQELTDCPACRATPLAPAAVDAATAQQVGQLLAQAQRPLLVLGGSGWTPRAHALLRTLVQHWQLPVACSFRRQDLFDNRDPHFVGHLSLGMSPAVRAMVQQADVLLALGARLTDVSTGEYELLQVPRPQQTLVHCHPGADELGRVYQADVAIAASPEALLQALLDWGQSASAAPQPGAWQGWLSQGRAGYEAFIGLGSAAPDGQSEGVDLRAVVQYLDHELPEDAILTNGAGNYAIWLHRFFRYRQPRTELASTCGAMGYGLPAAIAAALRHRQRQVVCFAGDGCFMMYPQELATAAECGARLTVLLVNNGMYGTIRMHQARRYPGRVSATRLPSPDYCALARACGAHAELVTRTEDFAAAWQRAQQSGRLALIELRTDPLQITPEQRLTPENA